ncbi:hypothetical protein D6833_04280 [Candidatus Parcubacteria bacterium]|nr:MAG: hypothetical protein D6833_04280 [Candidatus Parcubacteria bacterium]
MKKSMGLVFIFVCLGAASLARDLNRQSYHVGERASAMAGAFTAMGGDAASSYYNPAGLAVMSKKGISLSASMYQLLIENYHDALDVTMEDGSKIHASMESRTFGTFPSSVIYVLPLDDRPYDSDFHQVLAFSVLVPHYDKYNGSVNRPIGLWAFELKGSLFNEDTTYWAGPSWAVGLGRLRIGASLFALFHISDMRYNLALKTVLTDPSAGDVYFYATRSVERSGFGITMLAQLGAQMDITDHLTLGLSVRTPTFGTFYSNVDILSLNSSYAADAQGNPVSVEQVTDYVDRIETHDVVMNYWLPLKVSIGAAYEVEGSFAVALDLSLHLPQGPYHLFSGKAVYPTEALGQPIIDNDRVLIPDDRRKNSLIVNANVGAEVTLAAGYFLRGGFFTDFSAVDQGFYDVGEEERMDALYLPRLHRFGGTLGVGMSGKRTTTSVNVTYTYGLGSTFSFNNLFGVPGTKTDASAHTITVCLAGSADM